MNTKVSQTWGRHHAAPSFYSQPASISAMRLKPPARTIAIQQAPSTLRLSPASTPTQDASPPLRAPRPGMDSLLCRSTRALFLQLSDPPALFGDELSDGCIRYSFSFAFADPCPLLFMPASEAHATCKSIYEFSPALRSFLASQNSMTCRVIPCAVFRAVKKLHWAASNKPKEKSYE